MRCYVNKLSWRETVRKKHELQANLSQICIWKMLAVDKDKKCTSTLEKRKLIVITFLIGINCTL